jgi:hypothetical protein
MADCSRFAHYIQLCALFLLAIPIGFWLLFGIGETIGGDMSGVIHLVPAFLVGLLIVVGWRWPLYGGALLLLFGIAEALAFSATGILLILGGPLMLSGLLLVVAGLLARTSLLPPGPQAR